MKKALMILAGAATVGALVRSRTGRRAADIRPDDPVGTVRDIDRATANPDGVRP